MKKTIKLTEQEFKNIIENSILKEEYNVFKDPKAKALIDFLMETEVEEEYTLSELKLRYDYYGLNLYEVGNREYAVGTDREADNAASEEIKQFVWAFNKDFIIEHSSALDFDEPSEQILDAIQQQSESGNNALLKLIDNIDEFIKDAIQSDGRGHFISHYDGEENESGGYYIYRIN